MNNEFKDEELQEFIDLTKQIAEIQRKNMGEIMPLYNRQQQLLQKLKADKIGTERKSYGSSEHSSTMDSKSIERQQRTEERKEEKRID